MPDSGESAPGLFLEDGLHPSRDGHRVMAGLVIEQMRGDFQFWIRNTDGFGRPVS